jgi:4-hydroxy-3-polyprenylbenzoate decarboxylase
VVVSQAAEAVMSYELREGHSLRADYHWGPDDFRAPIASSSRAPEAMVIVPCSVKTLSGIVHGYADTLIVRVADVMLRMGRPLVLVPRETPLSLSAIENMRLAKLSGAILLPPSVAYYPQPQSIDDITDFIVGKILDVLQVDHDLYRRWAT